MKVTNLPTRGLGLYSTRPVFKRAFPPLYTHIGHRAQRNVNHEFAEVKSVRLQVSVFFPARPAGGVCACLFLFSPRKSITEEGSCSVSRWSGELLASPVGDPTTVMEALCQSFHGHRRAGAPEAMRIAVAISEIIPMGHDFRSRVLLHHTLPFPRVAHRTITTSTPSAHTELMGHELAFAVGVEMQNRRPR